MIKSFTALLVSLMQENIDELSLISYYMIMLLVSLTLKKALIFVFDIDGAIKTAC